MVSELNVKLNSIGRDIESPLSWIFCLGHRYSLAGSSSWETAATTAVSGRSGLGTFGDVRDDGLVADPDEMIDVDLSDEERFVLNRGLVEWGGPASCTDALAVAMGFDSVADLAIQSDRLLQALTARQALSRWDWTRVLLATEIVFASDIVGSGVEWPTTTGLGDEETLGVLRTVQRKLVTATVPIGPRGAWRRQ